MARYCINYELGIVLCTKLLNARRLSQTALVIIIIFGAFICYQFAAGEHRFAALLQPDHCGSYLRPFCHLVYYHWGLTILPHPLRLSFHYAFDRLIGFAFLLAQNLVIPGDAFLAVIHGWRPSRLICLVNHDLSNGPRGALTQDHRCCFLGKLGFLFPAEKEFRLPVFVRELEVFEGWAVLILMGS